MTELKGFAFISVPILGWGLAPIIVSLGLEYLDVLVFFTYRFVFAWLITTPYIIWRRREQVRRLLTTRWTLFVGMAHILALFSQYISQLYISPSISSTIAYSYLVLVPFVSTLLLKKKLEWFHLVVVLTAITGAVIMVTEGDLTTLNVDLRGVLFALLSTLGFAFYIVSTSRLVTVEMEDVDSFSLFYLIISLVSAVGLAFSLALGGNLNPMSIDLQGWFYIAMLAVISTVLAYTAYIQSLKYLSANVASVLLLLQIAIPYAIEFFVFSITYSMWVLLGGAVVVSSSAILIWRSKDKLH